MLLETEVEKCIGGWEDCLEDVWRDFGYHGVKLVTLPRNVVINAD